MGTLTLILVSFNPGHSALRHLSGHRFDFMPAVHHLICNSFTDDKDDEDDWYPDCGDVRAMESGPQTVADIIKTLTQQQQQHQSTGQRFDRSAFSNAPINDLRIYDST